MSDEGRYLVRQRVAADPEFRERLRTGPLAALAEYDLDEGDRRRVVLPNFGWIIEGRLAGVSRPRTEDAYLTLAGLGVGALLTLTEEPLLPETLARHGLRATHIPVPDFMPPTPAQVEQAMAALDTFHEQGLTVAVHCAAGLGRTGTILACCLVRQGTPAHEAITTIRTTRPGSIETAAQEAAVEAYARLLASRRAKAAPRDPSQPGDAAAPTPNP